jgi:4-hydroxy-tetrahydrodipicolinate reductase
MIKAVVAGAAGRMGGRIIHMIQQSEEITLTGSFERPDHPAIGKDVGEIVGLGKIGIDLAADISNAMKDADVLIDFTTPESTLHNIRFIAETGQAMVIGTTGITGEDEKGLQLLAQKIRCVRSPNMSVGVNVLFKVVEDLSIILGKDWDMEVIIGVRTAEEIGIQSIRAGDIVGEHTVMFAGTGERIEITHRAHSRDNFAKGALRAALWVVTQSNGLYDMQGVLGLR